MNTRMLTCIAAVSLLSPLAPAQQANSAYSSTGSSTFDNPGVLGRNYIDLGLSWEDIDGTSDPAYNAMFAANLPVTSGVDAKLAYNYWWYKYGGVDSRYHLLAGELKVFAPNARGVKPFGGVLLGYQWSKYNYGGYVSDPGAATSATVAGTGATVITSSTPPGTAPTDTSGGIYGPPGTTTTDGTGASAGLTYLSLRNRENFGVWGLSAGLEVPAGTFAFTPHLAYLDTFDSDYNSSYHYGVEAHHWFSEGLGGYADVTYNDVSYAPNSWSYTAGVRLRF